jgi:hypothetical protein
MAKSRTLELPAATTDEISAAAARSERSIAFLVLGALKSAPALSGDPSPGPRKPLVLSTDEDDPRDLPKRLDKLVADKAKGKSLDDAVALAWAARRAQILAWVDRIASVDEGQKADDLDSGLRDAASATTPASRLIELAKSPYPRVRALVAAHESAPPEALRLLASDKERIVMEALEERG